MPVVGIHQRRGKLANHAIEHARAILGGWRVILIPETCASVCIFFHWNAREQVWVAPTGAAAVEGINKEVGLYFNRVDPMQICDVFARKRCHVGVALRARDPEYFKAGRCRADRERVRAREGELVRAGRVPDRKRQRVVQIPQHRRRIEIPVR